MTTTSKLHYTHAVKALQRAYIEAETEGPSKTLEADLDEVIRECRAWREEMFATREDQRRSEHKQAMRLVPPHERSR